MSGYRVIGIDPALVNTGLCVLESEAPGRYRVVDTSTIVTSEKKPILDRLDLIREGVASFLFLRAATSEAVVIEDPTCQSAIVRQIPRNIAVMSLAVGIAVGVALQSGAKRIEMVDPAKWMPKVQNKGRLWHIMPHAQTIRTLLGWIKIPPKASEHVIMAAGVARWWIEQERMKARLSA